MTQKDLDRGILGVVATLVKRVLGTRSSKRRSFKTFTSIGGVCSVVRTFGLGNALKGCYITAVTGTDVDLSSVRFEEWVWAWGNQEAGEIAHGAAK